MKKIMTTFGLLTLFLTSNPIYADNSQDKLTGLYDESGVDYVSRHYFVPNGKYCYVGMIGELDLQFAGDWKFTGVDDKGNAGVQIFPQSLVKTPYPVWINKKESRANRTLKFITKRFTSAGMPIFIGFGEQKDKLSQFAPMFANNDNLQAQYELTVPKNANYLFVGHEVDKGKYQLTRYPLSKDIKHTIQLSYDFNAYYAKQMQSTRLQYKNDTLSVENGGKITKTPLNSKEIAEVQNQCIKPILQGDPKQLFPENSELLNPTVITLQGKFTQPAWF